MNDNILTETTRLLVRRLTEADAGELYAVLSDPEVMRYIEPPFSLEQTRDFILQAGCCEPPLVWAVIWKGDASAISVAGGEKTPQSHPLIGHLIWHPWDETAMELGWILRRDFWGRGIAKELTAAMLAQTDRDLVLECHPNQTATRRIAELFGFRMLAERGSLLQYRKNAVEHMRIEESDNTTNKLVTK